MYNLYLDDFRQPTDSFDYLGNPIYNKLKWEIVRNYDDFVKIIEERGVPNTISFDHDLSDEHYKHQTVINYDLQEKTGFHCAKWLINYCIDNKKELPTTILIHSMNPAGSLNIKSLFDTYNKYLKA
jgi:hypothetical protein